MENPRPKETGRLETRGLVKSYRDRRVVNEVTLDISPGEIVGLLGPNGAGKTTTFYIIVGLVRPDKGQILLDGKDISSLAMYKRAQMGIGYLPQEPSVFRKLTVEENILAILEAQGIERSTRKKKARDLMEELNIYHVRKSRGYSLSGGERRRVEICRALATSPSFMLLDEPFAGIDPIVVGDIQNMVIQLKNMGIGVLITDHNVRETLQIVDRAYILNEGEVLESGSPEIIANSQKARDIYLGERFSLGS